MEVTQILKSDYSIEDKKVMDYFRVIADLMRLRDYDFVLLQQQEEADDESIKYASMRCQPGAKAGGLYYHPLLLELQPETIRLILCHEACHALTDRIQLTSQIHVDNPAFHSQLDIELEFIVDDLSKIIAPNLPLPDFKGIDEWTVVKGSGRFDAIQVENILDLDLTKPISIQLGSGNSIYEWPATIKSTDIENNIIFLRFEMPEIPHIGAIVSNITESDLLAHQEKEIEKSFKDLGHAIVNRESCDLSLILVDSLYNLDISLPIKIQLGEGTEIYDWPSLNGTYQTDLKAIKLDHPLPEIPKIGAVVSNIKRQDYEPLKKKALDHMHII